MRPAKQYYFHLVPGLDLFEMISDIINMYDTLCKNPLAPPSRMLANKHVLYLYMYVFHCRSLNGFDLIP